MAKHPRKRQKTSKADDRALSKSARLAKLLDEESKDDEERRLESMLFGTKYVPRGGEKGKAKDTSDSEESSEDEDGGGRGMQHLLDEDLFFVDDSLGASGSNDVLTPTFGGEDEEPDSESGDNSASDEESGSDSLPSSSSSPRSNKVLSSKSLPKSLTASRSKPPAWVDPADTQLAPISLLNGPSRLRKLRQGVEEDEITSREYETRLRNQFERINPEPAWARKARGKKSKKSSVDDLSDGEEEEEGDGIHDLLSSTQGILGDSKRKGKQSVVLPQGTLSIERTRDANHSAQSSSSGEVRVVAFHPKPAVPVLCVATADRRVRLFHVDGHLSPLLTTLHVPSIPLVSDSSVLFHPQGNSLLISGPRPFFYTYDLQQGTSTLHRRGLWGTGFDDSSILGPSNTKRRRPNGKAAETSGGGGKGGGGNTDGILHTAFSPGTGSMLAVAGRGGNVHLVDWKSGAGQVVGSLKCTSSGGGGGGGVKGLWWVPSPSEAEHGVLGAAGYGDEGKYLAMLTGEAEVYIWDVGQRRCVKRWKDEGGYRGAGRVLAGGGGPNGWMAIGSTSGFVNVYGADSFAMPHNGDTFSISSGRDNPKMVKALGQLTTPISSLKFNHDSQLLAMASKDKKDALRMIHLPSLTAFANWPTSSTPLGHVSAIDFAPRSEYVAIGNTRGRVLLYHLKDYGAGGS